MNTDKALDNQRLVLFTPIVIAILFLGLDFLMPRISHANPQDSELRDIFMRLHEHSSIEMDDIMYSFSEGSRSLAHENMTGAGLYGFLLKDSLGETSKRHFMVSYDLIDGHWHYSHVGLGWEDGYDEQLYKADGQLLEEIVHELINASNNRVQTIGDKSPQPDP